jgi:hypothetical protein
MKKSGAVFYPQIDPVTWAKRYDLSIVPLNCPVCKKLVTPNVPFAIRGWRGLCTADHGCKANGAPSVARPVGETGRQWKATCDALFEALKR